MGDPYPVLDARDSWAQNGGAPIMTTSPDWAGSGTSAADEDGGVSNTSFDQMGNFTGISFLDNFMPTWSASKIPAAYANTIRQAETANGLPTNLLARLLFQESRFRPDIIAGTTTSAAGAQGIAQFMPKTAAALNINPLDPFQAIPAAAGMLKNLYDITGTWALALAAYNWGIGNLTKKGIDRAPVETQQYYKSILADIGMRPVLA
jgi:hypothetical protein